MKKYIPLLLVLCVFSSCLKLQTNAKYNSNGDYWSGYTLTEWLHSERNQNCLIFAYAIRLAGMEELFSSLEPSTVIIPNDDAFRQLFSEIGMNTIEEFGTPVLKELLSYLVMSQRFISTEMQDGMIIVAQNLNEKPLFLSKKANSSNRHQLYVNVHIPEGISDFAATSATVVMQDVLFKDHVAQIVSNVPYYKPYTIKTDDYTGTPHADQMLEIKTKADTYLFSKMLTSRANYPVLLNTERIPIILYENPGSIDFYNEISVVKVWFYLSKIEGISVNPFVLYDITDQAWQLTREGQDVSLFYNAVYNDYVPEISAANKVTTFDFGSGGRWTAVDITNFILNHYKEAGAKPVAFTIAPANSFYSTVGILNLGYKKESNGDITNKPSYIQVLGRMDSKIILQNSRALRCEGAVPLTADELLCTAPVIPDGLVYSPNNIIYRITESPSNGVLAKNCLPLRTGDVFTQMEVNAGAIKYYKTGPAATDEFTLKAGDYSGATLSSPVKILVL